MRCRYCAGEKPDEVEEISLRTALKGIKGEFLIYHYEEAFDRAYYPSGVAFDSKRVWFDAKGAVIDFAAKQCIRYTHTKNKWRVTVHPCPEKDKTIFHATGGVSSIPGFLKAFTDFFNAVMRDGETRGRRAGQKDVKPRWRRETTDTARHRQEILVAIRKIGREPVYRKDVARAIGVRSATLRDWVTEIGEEWDDLVNEALR